MQKLAFFVCVLISVNGPLMAEEVAPDQRVEMDPRGAVLCSYAITVSLEAARSRCRADAVGLRDLFSYSLERHREFVARNSKESIEYWQAFEDSQADMAEQSCDELADNQILGWLDLIENDREAFRAEIDYSLAVDREPVWNPCL